MADRPPLQIHLLFHQKSEDGRALAESMVPHLMAGPATAGLRLPVLLTPDRGDDLPPSALDLDAAEHTVVVVLADGFMQQRIESTGAQWADFVRNLVETHDRERQHVLLVALDEAGFKVDEATAERHFVSLVKEPDRETRRATLAFHLAVRSLLLLRELPVPQQDTGTLQAPVSLFLSHAKADKDEVARNGPVDRVLECMGQLPIESWYDAAKIDPGERFTDKIRDGIRGADLMVVFLTDSWAKSEWCRREAVWAKRSGTPILVVDALDEGEPRSFPYTGNVRTMRWRDTGGNAEAGRREATRVLCAAVQETVRRVHTRRLLDREKRNDDVVLDSAPEAAHLSFHPGKNSFLYPDPPLGSEEYELLRGLRPDARFETPLMRTARHLDLREPLTIAVSVSDSEVLAEHGLVEHHLTTITDEIHLYLLIAGLRIAYGGKLEPDKLDDPKNFTLRLFDIVDGYQGLAQNAGAQLAPILNVAPWPLHYLYEPKVLQKFGTIAELEKMPCPDLGFPEDRLQPQPNGFVKPDTVEHSFAWGLAMTEMREHITELSFARIAIGGKIEGYQGRCAGLIEEPLMSLRAHKPLFLVGALGGCTQLVIDLLEQRDRPEMTTAVAREEVGDYDALAACYAQHGKPFASREEIAAELRQHGQSGPAAALRNGLDDKENSELFAATEPRRIAKLILTGIERLRSRGGTG